MTDRLKVYASYSHSSPGRSLCEYFIEQLVDRYDCEIAKDTLIGGIHDIVERIRSSDVLVALIDPKTSDSAWMSREIDIARGAGIATIPIKITDPIQGDYDISPALEHFSLRAVQYHVYDNSKAGLASIYAALQRLAIQTRTAKSKASLERFKPMFGDPSFEVQFQCDIFMIMPFAEDFQPIYSDHILSLVEAKQLKIKRGDDFFANHSIMTDIWSAIFASQLVIGDCTGQNANVFYELGIAHTLGRPTILITQGLDDIPFDLRHLRIIQYDYTPPGMKKFEEKLSDAIDKLL